ncbi:MAG: hypothetical protein M3R00_02020 [Pseudomonadota bacterium]|nr:hypothetical protein [Pseudomonadota bacterium]
MSKLKIESASFGTVNYTVKKLEAAVEEHGVDVVVPYEWRNIDSLGKVIKTDWPILMHFVFYGRHDLVGYLLDKGADPNGCCSVTKTPLLLLANDYRMFELLMAKNVNYAAAVQWGQTEGLHSGINNYYVQDWFVKLLSYLTKRSNGTLYLNLFQNPKVFADKAIFGRMATESEQYAIRFFTSQYEKMQQLIMNKIELDQDVAKLLKDFCGQFKHPMIQIFFQLLIVKNYHDAFEQLLDRDSSNNTPLAHVKLLLAQCYINRWGCDSDIPKAMENLQQAFQLFHGAGASILVNIVISLFEKIDKPYNKTSQYHSTLGHMYRKVGRYKEATVQFAFAGDCTEQYQDTFFEMALKQKGATEEVLPAFLRAAQVGSVDACIHIGDFYRDGKLGRHSDFIQAVEYYYRGGLLKNGFAKAEASLNYLLGSPATSDATREFIRKKFMELQFKLTVVDKSTLTPALKYANDSPLLATLLRECCNQDGVRNQAVEQYYFTMDLQTLCQTKYLGHETNESVYAHFLMATELLRDGLIFSGYLDKKVQGLLHMSAAIMIVDRIDPEQQHVVLRELHARIITLFTRLQQHKDAELSQCANYLSLILFSRETLPTSLEMPVRIRNQLPNSHVNSNHDDPIVLPNCFLHQLDVNESHAPKASDSTRSVLSRLSEAPEHIASNVPSAPAFEEVRPLDNPIHDTDTHTFSKWCQSFRANPNSRKMVQLLVPGLRLGCTGAEDNSNKKNHRRWRSF